MEKLRKNSSNYLDELPPTREMVEMYKNKLEKCKKDFESLTRNLQTLKLELEDRGRLESTVEAMEEKLKLANAVLSRTQALLLTERNNCQQLALHIDLLKKQHEMDREKLNLLLSLNGKPVPNHYFQGELVFKQHMAKMDKLMKEQASKLLEERSLMKIEWDKERHINEKSKKELRQRIQGLQEQLLLVNEHRMLYSQKHIQDFLAGKSVMEDHDFFHFENPSSVCDTKLDHCSTQEMKRLTKRVKALQDEVESYQKQCSVQKNVIQEIKEESQKRQEKFQAQTKGMKENLEKLKEENNQLNKRRLIEGSGFRSEIKILRDQLHRTQRQLCFLTMRKYEE